MTKWVGQPLEDLKSGLSWDEFNERHPHITYDAWEVKRRRVGRTIDEPWSPFRIQRAVTNNVKMARQVIRLRHSIEADDELADAIPRITAILVEQAHAGQVSGLSFDQLRQLIYGQ